MNVGLCMVYNLRSSHVSTQCPCHLSLQVSPCRIKGLWKGTGFLDPALCHVLGSLYHHNSVPSLSASGTFRALLPSPSHSSHRPRVLSVAKEHVLKPLTGRGEVWPEVGTTAETKFLSPLYRFSGKDRSYVTLNSMILELL